MIAMIIKYIQLQKNETEQLLQRSLRILRLQLQSTNIQISIFSRSYYSLIEAQNS
jgi:hypothetical protein